MVDRSQVNNIIENVVASIKTEVPEHIDDVKDIEANLLIFSNDINVADELGRLFQWEKIEDNKPFSKGFPGIVLTAGIGKLLKPTYNPSKDFYAINPRPLFEKHIGPVLRDKYKAPMGKSDPLNVAKNISVIDEAWAKGKRPAYAAYSAVNLIRQIQNSSPSEIIKLLELLVWCYLSLSKLYNRPLPLIQTGLSVKTTHKILENLINEATAGGATAQIVVGSLLKSQQDLYGAQDNLDGVGESVNASNTTSGKAGDFTETFGNSLRIYEVTTKTIDMQRLNESADSINRFLLSISSLANIDATFLCNTKYITLNVANEVDKNTGTIQIQNLVYSFIELSDWIFYMLERLGTSGRNTAMEYIQQYAQAPDTDLSVKDIWEKQHSYNLDASS